jgi:hypothetical protein
MGSFLFEIKSLWDFSMNNEKKVRHGEKKRMYHSIRDRLTIGNSGTHYTTNRTWFKCLTIGKPRTYSLMYRIRIKCRTNPRGTCDFCLASSAPFYFRHWKAVPETKQDCEGRRALMQNIDRPGWSREPGEVVIQLSRQAQTSFARLMVRGSVTV